MITELLFILATSSAYDLSKEGLRRVFSKDYVARAIDATAESFSDLPYAKDSLKRWVESDAFFDNLTDIQSGQKTFSINEEIQLFIKEGQFSASVVNTEDQAKQVLELFNINLEKAILKSEDAHLLREARDEIRHAISMNAHRQSKSAIEQIEQLRNRPYPIVIREGNRKTSYDEEATWINSHELRFFIRQNNRPMEIDLFKSTAGERFNLLEVQIVFEGHRRHFFDFDTNLKKLLKTKTLSPNFGENWLKLDSGRPVEDFKSAFHIEWFLNGTVLLREFPELVFLPWLDRDFLTYPTRAEAGTGEPRDAPKIIFFLNETDLIRQDERLATIPDYKPRSKQLSDYLLD